MLHSNRCQAVDIRAGIKQEFDVMLEVSVRGVTNRFLGGLWDFLVPGSRLNLDARYRKALGLEIPAQLRGRIPLRRQSSASMSCQHGL